MSAQTFRNIGIALQCQVAPYVAGLQVAAAKTKEFSAEVRRAGEAGNDSMRKIAQGATIVGAGMLAGFGLAAKATMGFEAQMSEVGAVASATSGQLKELSDAALKAGADTVFSASEAAKAEAELAKAGVAVKDILGGALTGALDLASAGNLDLGRSAEIAANAMAIFQLKGSDVPHVADLLAAGANKSATDVEQMGQALAQGGMIAASMGARLEETVGTLASFSQYALKGSDAGTSLKSMMVQLNPKTKEAASMMKELGLDFTDGHGRFKDMAGIAEELRSKMSNLSVVQREAALTTMFGVDGQRAALAMYNEGGVGIRKWTSDVNESGYAAEVAAKKTDNLKGDVEQLKGSFETLLIKSGEGSSGGLRSLTQTLTSTVNGFAAMPGPVASVTSGLVGLAGAGLTTVGVVGTLAPKWAEFKKTLEATGPAGERAAAGMGKMAKGVGVAVAGIGLASVFLGKYSEKLGEVSTFMENASKTAANRAMAESGTKYFENYRKQVTEFDKLVEESHRLADGLGHITNRDQINQNEAAAGALRPTIEAMSALIEKTQKLAKERNLSFDEAFKLAQAEDANQKSIDATGKSLEDALDPTKKIGEATKDAAKEVKDLATAFNDAESAMKGYFDAATKPLDTQIALREASQKWIDGLAKNGNQFNYLTGQMMVNTAAGKENLANAKEFVRKAGDAALAEAQRTGSIEAGTRALESQRGSFIAQMQAMGVTRKGAEDYANQLGLIPRDIETKWRNAGLDESLAKAKSLEGAMERLANGTANLTGPNVLADARSGAEAAARYAAAHGIGHRASGGPFPAGWTGWVGEKGPELVTFTQAGYVTNASDSARMTTPQPGQSGMSSTVNVTVNAPNYVGPREELTRVVMDAIYESRKRFG